MRPSHFVRLALGAAAAAAVLVLMTSPASRGARTSSSAGIGVEDATSATTSPDLAKLGLAAGKAGNTAPLAAFTVTSRPTKASDRSAASTAAISCSGAGKSGTAYDYPHPSQSSGKTEINAHFTVTCTGPIPLIQVGSMMCTQHRARCGPISDNDARNKATVRTGGQLACRATKDTYQAFGVYNLVFPAGYQPPSIVGGVASVKRAYVLGATTCVAAH